MSCLHARALVALCLPLVMSVAVAGCSSDDGKDLTAGKSHGSIATSAPEVRVRTTVTRVHGDLPKAQRDRLEQRAEKLVTDFVEASYFHRRPGSGYRGSFPGFTRDARAMALKDTRVASDRAYADATEVRPRGATAYLSVVSPHGRPVGATARLTVNLEVVQGDRTRWKRVTGRLLLTPGAHRWRIFGYDLAMGPAAPTRGRAR